jgi:tRNA (guanine-N7-)-methyltransferase
MRIRHHRNPLSASYLSRPQVRHLELLHDRIEVELGCADARFLIERAPHHPHTEFIGLEIREDFVDEVARTALEHGLHNVRCVAAHINLDFGRLFENDSLACVFINFPDPWFKRRHQNRRLLDPLLVREICSKLRDGGELFFQSDIFDLALEMLALGESEGFVNCSGAWSFTARNPFGAKSLREVRCEEKGLRIWRVHFRKRSSLS